MALAVKLAPLLEQRGWNPRELCTYLSVNPNVLDDICEGLVAPNSEVLLYIDQFEELFNLVNEEWRKPFIDMLTTARTARHFRIIVTLRADFYHRCVEWTELAEMLENGQFPLGVSPKL